MAENKRWSQTELDTLVFLWVEKKIPLRKIAPQLQRSLGSITGQIKRLDLFGEGAGWSHKSKKVRATPEEVKRLTDFWNPILNTSPVSLLELQPHHCRWPIDRRCRDGLAMYCGAPRLPGHSECAAHALLKVKVDG